MKRHTFAALVALLLLLAVPALVLGPAYAANVTPPTPSGGGGGITLKQWMHGDTYEVSGSVTNVEANNRIQTFGVTIPGEIAADSVVIGRGTGTSTCSWGLYDTSGSLVLSTAATSTAALASGWHAVAISGAPVTVSGGTYIGAYTCATTAATFRILPDGLTITGGDIYKGHASETSTGGALPASITPGSITASVSRRSILLGLRDT